MAQVIPTVGDFGALDGQYSSWLNDTGVFEAFPIEASSIEKFVYPLGFTFPGPRQFTFYLLSKILDLSG